MNSAKKKVLFLFPSLNFYQDPQTWADRFSQLTDQFDLGILCLSSPSILGPRLFTAISIFTTGKRDNYLSSAIRNAIIFFSIPKAVYLFFSGQFRFHGVVVFNPLASGLAGLLICKLTGAKLICEINGNYEAAFRYGATPNDTPSRLQRLKSSASIAVIRFVAGRADVVRLLYPTQLLPLGIRGTKDNICTCPEFVPIQRFIASTKSDEKYVLFVGYPFYLKGVDTLIAAFNEISPSFPQYALKIVGYCPDGKEYFDSLARSNQKIEICKPVPYDEIVGLMAKCSILVLPSRTEAMGRVLIEAMASSKPVIGSNVDGIPHVIADGYNGLLTAVGNVQDLAEKIGALLGDGAKYRLLAKGALDSARSRYSEAKYGELYGDMLAKAMGEPTKFERKLLDLVNSYHCASSADECSRNFSCRISQKGRHRRLLLFYPDGSVQPKYFAKVGSESTVSFRNEYNAIKILNRNPVIQGSIPDAVTYVEEQGFSALIETAVRGRPIGTVKLWEPWQKNEVVCNIDRVYAWWKTLVDATPRPQSGICVAREIDDVRKAFILCHGAEKLHPRIQIALDHVQTVARSTARLSLVHGDLWCGNILDSGNGIVVVDWERTANQGLPFLDFLLFLSTLVDDSSVKGMVDVMFRANWLSKVVCGYMVQACRFLSISKMEAEDMLIYFLVTMSSQVMRRFGTKSAWDSNWYNRLDYVLKNDKKCRQIFSQLPEPY